MIVLAAEAQGGSTGMMLAGRLARDVLHRDFWWLALAVPRRL
jgi:hypothetical protein